MAWQTFASGAILLGVIGGIIWRPRGYDVAVFTSIGATLIVALGILPAITYARIFGDVWDAAATLVALFLISEVLDRCGFFDWAALVLARFADGSGWRLYGWMLILTTMVTALLANDGAVLMLTPIFIQLLKRVYPSPGLWLPFLFATGFFADAMSLLFVPSNLTNIILADALHLSFIRVVLWMALPTLCAFVSGALAFGWRFRHSLRTRYSVSELPEPAGEIRDMRIFRASWGALIALLLGYLIGSVYGWPVALPAGVVALVMVALMRWSGTANARTIVQAAPWSVLLYAAGMFVVITAAFTTHVLDFIVVPLQRAATAGSVLLGAAGTLGLTTLLAAAVNNLPAALITVLSFRHVAHPAVASAFGILIGVDIGPKLTPFGSLATLLWLGILKRQGVEVSWGRFIQENWWVTLVVLASAFGGLCLIQYVLVAA